MTTPQSGQPTGDLVAPPNPARWVDEYGDFLYRYALSRLRDAEAAEDVVQDTFVSGIQALDRYAGKGTERAWLLGILKRKIVDHVRSRTRTGLQSEEASDELSASLFNHKGSWQADPRFLGSQPDAAILRQEFWQIFRDCLKHLPQRQADVFVLRELEGLNGEEVCKEMELSPSNLWVMLYRARLRLSSCIKSQLELE